MPPSISISDLWRLMMRGVIGLPVGLTISVAAGLLYLFLASPYYVVTMSVMPTNSAQSTGGLMQPYLSSFLSGRAGGNPKFEVFLQILTGPATSETLIKSRPNIIKQMFPARWNASADKWIYEPPSFFERMLGRNYHVIAPNYADVSAYLTKNIEVSNSVSSPLTTLRVKTFNPRFGVILLRDTYLAAEEVLRHNQKAYSKIKLEFLLRRLSRSNKKDEEATLIKLITEQEKNLMLLSKRLPYVAQVVEPPQLPVIPAGPSPVKTLLVSIIIGLFFGVATSIVIGLSLEKFSKPA